MTELFLHARDNQPDEAIFRNPAILFEADGIPDLGADAIGADDQIGFENLAGLKRQATFRIGGTGPTSRRVTSLRS